MAARRQASDLARLMERTAALQHLDGQDAAVTERLRRLRAWQAARLARTYEDLARDPDQAPAVHFFLTDLYGPQDFSRRDRDLARALPVLRRALPRSALSVLIEAIELYLLSAELDQALAGALGTDTLTAESYARAYRAVGRAGERRRQIELTVQIGERLARAVTRPLIGLALRTTHVPAHVGGFGALQDFLERGFNAFRRLRDPQAFLQTIRTRELTLNEALLQSGASPVPAEATARSARRRGDG
ncbi:MAG: FFLEELY motif protein [Steroidobacteraceae bacterium]